GFLCPRRVLQSALSRARESNSWEFSCGSANRIKRPFFRLCGWASFYDTAALLSPVPAGGLAAARGSLFAPGGGGLSGRTQVRPARAREALGFGAAPRLDLGVVAAGEHRRDGTALPQLRSRILRIFEQALAETFLRARGLFAHDAGEEPHAGIEQDQGCDLPAREHVIADRHFLKPAAFDEPLVDAFEAAAEDDGAFPLRQRRHAGLRERNPARAHDEARAWIVCRDRRVHGATEHV